VAEVNGPFDLGISRFAIHHLSDARKRALYTEIFELLRPDGLFIQIEHVKSHSAVYERAFYTSLVDGVFRVESGARSRAEILASFVDSGERAANILVPVEDQLRWMRKSGFADVDCLFKAFELAVFAGRKPIPGSSLNA
jgi:SAM-dependent methyltransferase